MPNIEERRKRGDVRAPSFVVDGGCIFWQDRVDLPRTGVHHMSEAQSSDTEAVCLIPGVGPARDRPREMTLRKTATRCEIAGAQARRCGPWKAVAERACFPADVATPANMAAAIE